MVPKQKVCGPAEPTARLPLIDSHQSPPATTQMRHDMQSPMLADTNQRPVPGLAIEYADRDEVIASALRMMQIHADTFRKLAE